MHFIKIHALHKNFFELSAGLFISVEAGFKQDDSLSPAFHKTCFFFVGFGCIVNCQKSLAIFFKFLFK